MDLYQRAIRPLLFSSNPEWIHHRLMLTLSWLEQSRQTSIATWFQQQLSENFCLQDDRLRQQLWQQSFENPLGLAAGFDKDGLATHLWPCFGFGFAELGTITLHAQPGNPKPRLFRLPSDFAILNRMGFNNQGAAALATNLAALANQPKLYPLGINLGKSKITPLEEAAADYLQSFQLLKAIGDYFVVNVSSPNTPGLRSLQASSQLSPILEALQQENSDRKPLLVKIAPDLDWDQIADIVQLAQTYHLAGIIATNTTLRRDHLQTQILASTGQSVQNEAGGISGRPLTSRATEIIRFIWQQTQGTLPIVGVGGIFTTEDAWEKITAGASLLQIYTGWIYEGPWAIKRILAGLLTKLESAGLTHLSQAVGISAHQDSQSG